jgi:hypothetical protein
LLIRFGDIGGLKVLINECKLFDITGKGVVLSRKNWYTHPYTSLKEIMKKEK